MLQWHRILLGALLVVVPAHGFAQDIEARPRAREQDKSALRAELDDLVSKASLGDGIGIVVADTSNGERLYQRNPETPRNPASNMKLVTAATALLELGASYRMRTTLAGQIGPEGEVETLVLRGEGDPSLSFGDLLSMTRRLVDLGVRRVENVVVDGSYFDEQMLPP